MTTNPEEDIEALRHREWTGEPLTAVEQARLAAYYRHLDEAEMRYLAPVLERMRLRQEQQEEAIARLEALRDAAIERLSDHLALRMS
jgi:hypothetical protein